jgi:hypothetical protein
MASIYRRGKTWWMKYYVGGKAVRRSLKTRNAREAREICEQYSAAEKIGLLAEASSTPIRPFLQDLCEYWKRTRKPKGATNRMLCSGVASVTVGPSWSVRISN